MAIVTGDANDNTLGGTAGDDQISGLDGNDILQGSSGLDTLDGGDGFDWADYSGYTPPVANAGLILNRATATVNSALAPIPFNEPKDTISGIEGFRGTLYKDVMIGDSGADYFEGGAGADVFDGNGGNDVIAYTHSSAGVNVNLATNVLSGGDAEGDQISGSWSYAGASGTGEGAYGVWGSAYADTLTGGAGANELKGDGGDDLLTGGDGNDIIDGGSGNDIAFYSLDISNYTLSYSSGVITVTANSGTEGTDTLTGVDYIAFGDVIYDVSGWTGGAAPSPAAAFGTPSSGNDLLNGGSGNDTISAGGGNDMVYAGAGNDTINGGDGNDVLYGAGGDDILQGSYGLDALNGGAGFDWADYSGYTLMPGQQGLILNQAASTVSTALSIPFNELKDTISGIEGFRGTLYKDVMIGTSGADYFEGGAGADIFDGNGGNDIIAYTHSSAGVTVNLATNVLSGGDAQGDQISGSWSYAGASGTGEGAYGVWGSAYADTLTGSAGANELKGDAGNDLLTGGGGADILDGGDGNDTASYAGSSAGVTVSLVTNTGTGGDAQGDTLIDIENLTGSDNNDTLIGNGGDNVLDGGNGNDTLTGGAGNDTLTGGGGTDMAVYSLASSNYSIGVNNGVVTVTGLNGSDGIDTLTGVERLQFTDRTLTLLVGSNGNDTITGTADDDLIFASGGNDTINGGDGLDWIDYSVYTVPSPWTGMMIYAPTATVNHLGGTGPGNEVKDSFTNVEGFRGTAGVDILYGTGGAEYFEGGAGADIFDGNGGNDVVVYTHSLAGVNVNLQSGALSGGDADGDMIIGTWYFGFGRNDAEGVYGAWGSAYTDILVGSNVANELRGDDGNDQLTGGGGNDIIDGGDGDDIAFYSLDISNYTLTYNNGTITVAANAGSDGTDTVTGVEYLTFDDVIYDFRGWTGGALPAPAAAFGTATSGEDMLNGGSADESISGGEGNDKIYAGAGNDIVDGGGGHDQLFGAGGNDLFLASTGNDAINGGAGLDWIDYSSYTIPSPWTGMMIYVPTASANHVAGTGSANEVKDRFTNVEGFRGTTGVDILYGSAGAEYFEGGAGADIFDGNGGNDVAVYTDSSAGVKINLQTGAASGGDAEGDLLIGTWYFGGGRNDAEGIYGVWGSGYADELLGSNVANELAGGGGNDQLTGGGGNDIIDGGDGDDIAFYSLDISNYTLTYNNGAVTVAANVGSDGADTVTGVEYLAFNDTVYDLRGWTGGGLPPVAPAFGSATSGNDIINGGAGNDTLSGGDGMDAIYGGAGNDVIDGGNGNDILRGAAGDDVFVANTGNDTIYGGDGVDWVDYSSYAVPGPWTGMMMYEAGTVNHLGGTGPGNEVKDIIFGIEGFRGTAGVDILYGTSGDQYFEGGAGADIFDGNGGNDVAVYTHSSAAVSVNLATNVLSGGDAEGDIILGTWYFGGGQNNAEGVYGVWGSAYNDTLIGNHLANELKGAAGADQLTGGGGNDIIDGGDGNDAAFYSMAIYDYTIGYSNGAITVTANSGTEGTDTLTGVETLIFNGSAFDFTGWTGGALPNNGGELPGVTYGTSGSDTITGTAGDEIFDARGGYDAIYAMGGNDRILSSGDYDYVDGGDGFDWLDYSNYAFATTNRGVAINISDRSVYRFDYPDPNKVWASQFYSIEAARGSAYDDVLTGDASANILEGGTGADTLNGSYGSDTYLIGRGDGIDSIVQAGIGDAASTTDVVQFTSGVAYNQLWFSQSGNDLKIDVIGETASSVLLKDWYTDATRRVDSIQTADGSHSLSAANVQALVDAMASYSPPGSGQFTLDPQVANDLAPVFATTWA